MAIASSVIGGGVAGPSGDELPGAAHRGRVQPGARPETALSYGLFSLADALSDQCEKHAWRLLAEVANRMVSEVHLGHRLAVDESERHGRSAGGVVEPDAVTEQHRQDV